MMQANIKHLLGKLKKMADEPFDDAAHRKYHDLCINLYVCEYIKRSAMKKYEEVYNIQAAGLLEEAFTKIAAIDKAALEVVKEIESRLKTFMDEKQLKSNRILIHRYQIR